MEFERLLAYAERRRSPGARRHPLLLAQKRQFSLELNRAPPPCPAWNAFIETELARTRPNCPGPLAAQPADPLNQLFHATPGGRRPSVASNLLALLRGLAILLALSALAQPDWIA